MIDGHVVGISQGWCVGGSSANQSHQDEIIGLVTEPCEQPDQQGGKDGDGKAVENPFCTVKKVDVEELASRGKIYQSQKDGNSYLSQYGYPSTFGH